ncbi:E3 ubiquitin-protein ligase TRIM17-like [Amphiura filiformis]|uniref:E3 ubiquitin-protein ligase TRIM17-like n=1 Tax=Amphiura filiformis TaxID=82378 RepID=UPI003B219444
MAEDHLKCCVCIEIFTSENPPKEMIGCQHVFCKECLQKIVTLGCISCPECRTLTEVPNGKIEALRTSLRIMNLAEEHRKHTLAKERFECCLDHNNEPMQLFCRKCIKPICQFCLKDHEGDQVEELTKYKQRFHIKITKRTEKLYRRLKEWEMRKDELSKMESKMDAAVAYEEKKIHRIVEQHKKPIDEAGERSMQELHQFEQSQLDLVKSEKERAQRFVQEIDQVQSQCDEALQTGPDGDTDLYLIDTLIAKMEELKRHDPPKEINDNAIRFNPQPAPDINIGCVEEN